MELAQSESPSRTACLELSGGHRTSTPFPASDWQQHNFYDSRSLICWTSSTFLNLPWCLTIWTEIVFLAFGLFLAFGETVPFPRSLPRWRTPNNLLRWFHHVTETLEDGAAISVKCYGSTWGLENHSEACWVLDWPQNSQVLHDFWQCFGITWT